VVSPAAGWVGARRQLDVSTESTGRQTDPRILIAHSPDYVDVFAHEEYNWLRHPIKHLRQVDIEREAGSDEMRRWIESQGISIDIRSRRRRRTSHAIRDCYKYLVSIVR